jgi:hypothetical protein
MNAEAQFEPVAGYPGTTAIAADSSAFVAWATGCSIHRGYRDIAVPDSGYASVGDSASAIGPATQNGVVSLGDGGVATLTFAKPISDGAGFDFAVFENGFDFGGAGMAFLELAYVEVSSDGQRFVRFPSIDNVQDSNQIALAPMDGSLLHNLAGKYVYGYGTPFDLNELRDSTGLDIHHVTHVRIIDVVGSIDPLYARLDSRGHIINDPYPTNYPSSGFDLDAVGVIHQSMDSGGCTPGSGMVAMYPSPMSDRLHIMSESMSESHLTITDMDGRVIQAADFQDMMAISTQDWNAGIYCVRVISATGTVSKLISKQ